MVFFAEGPLSHLEIYLTQSDRRVLAKFPETMPPNIPAIQCRNRMPAAWAEMQKFLPRGPTSSAILPAAILIAALLLPVAAFAADPAAPLTWEQYRDHLALHSIADVEKSPVGRQDGFAVNAVWTVLASVLVFWMQAGFALVEAGFTRSKNTVNILMKNMMDFAIGSIAYWAVGFGLMFGKTNGWFGTTGFFLSGHTDNTWAYTFLLFQTVFAGTSATIVSGAMAERTKFLAYLIYSLFISLVLYPIFGSWAWGGLFEGGGWLEAPPGGLLSRLGLPRFIDFAGSTVVHSIGAWVALMGVVFLGPRLGKYGPHARPLRGHSMSLATLGVFILWMGWFGFNAGSTTGATGNAGPFAGAGKAIGLIAITTNLSACAGAISATTLTWLRTGKPEISMSLNGVLGGLVGVTAGCATVSPGSAIVIGSVAGALVVLGVDLFDRLKLDDPVGALSVHGLCGVWGTLAAAIFHVRGFSWAQLATQAIGVGAAFVWATSMGAGLFLALKATVGLRVSEEDEMDGLDLAEHGGEAYPREDIA